MLTVFLAKGQTAQTALSCHVHPADLDLLGVWDWLRQAVRGDRRLPAAERRRGLADRRHRRRARIPHAASARRLQRVHHTLPPGHAYPRRAAAAGPADLDCGCRSCTSLAAPVDAAFLANSFSPITAWRSLGSHHAVLLGALQINGATTAAVDLEARVDRMERRPERAWPDPHPVIQPRRAHHAGQPRRRHGPRGRQPEPGRWRCTSRRIDALWFAAPFDQLDGVPTPGELAAPVHQLGDTKHRMIRYRAVSSSRFQEYFPEPGIVTTRTGPSLTVDVPSSARPLPPDVGYVVPIFGWDRQVTTNTKTEVRRGNGLRVYLNRPWYSSGPAELLGVVLWPGGVGGSATPPPTDAQREANKAFITQWGLDPIWTAGSLVADPGDRDLPGRGSAPPPASPWRRRRSPSTSPATRSATTRNASCGTATSSSTTRRRTRRSCGWPWLAISRTRFPASSCPTWSWRISRSWRPTGPRRSPSTRPTRRDARLVVAGLAPDGPTQFLHHRDGGSPSARTWPAISAGSRPPRRTCASPRTARRRPSRSRSCSRPRCTSPAARRPASSGSSCASSRSSRSTRRRRRPQTSRNSARGWSTRRSCRSTIPLDVEAAASATVRKGNAMTDTVLLLEEFFAPGRDGGPVGVRHEPGGGLRRQRGHRPEQTRRAATPTSGGRACCSTSPTVHPMVTDRVHERAPATC